MIERYEQTHGRNCVKTYLVLSLVDFISEDEEGYPRFIILTDGPNGSLPPTHLEDLKELQGSVYVYVIRDGK